VNADQTFEQLKQQTIDKFFNLNPHFASFMGLHDPYDHLMPSGGTARFVENHKLVEDCVRQMKQTVDYNALNDGNKIDWHVLEDALALSRFDLEEVRFYERSPDAFDEVGGAFFTMITKDYAPLEKRIDAIIARLEKLPKYLQEFRSRFDTSKPVKLWTDLAIESAQQMPGLFQFIVMASKGKIPDALHSRLISTAMGLTQPFEEHTRWLQSLKAKTTDDWALGPQKFEKLLQLRHLGMTSDEIYQLGVKYLHDLKAERARIAAQLAPGKSTDDVMKMIEQNAPKTFEDAMDATRKAMKDAKQFIIDHDIATVYEDDKLLVEETPGFIAPLIPFAAMNMPSRFDKPMIGIYIVTRPKDMHNLGKHLNYASIRNTAVHEAFPGHFLQGTISNRNSIVHILAQGTETTEGWAHYCEQMMMERGFVKGLEAKLVQINDGIWRAVRIIVDVKLSRGEMAVDDAVNMLIQETGMSKEGAVAEVRRYTQTPSYALSYLLGKHLILQLRDEVERKMGDHFSDRFFHDTVTANGYLPVALLRQVFDQKIAKLNP
jgi:uncharacterized protein (DUF885 family)